MLHELAYNISHNLFKPLLLFFYAGFAIPLLRVKLEFPKVLYQSITLYLLLAIGWHGGEELAGLPTNMIGEALGFMLIGFITNTVIGFAAYAALRKFTGLRRVDAATVSGFYGSDSAGTFLTAVGVVTAMQLAYAPYMPVMLAVMEIPGCLVAIFLVSRLRNAGMDHHGNCPDEAGYQSPAVAAELRRIASDSHHELQTYDAARIADTSEELVTVGVEEERSRTESQSTGGGRPRPPAAGRESRGYQLPDGRGGHLSEEEEAEAELALQSTRGDNTPVARSKGIFSKELLHEVFLNPGIFLLFGGITIGFLSRLQGEKVIADGDKLFINLFQGVLCLFLLEMGMTAAQKLKDLKAAGPRFIAFGLLAPNLFATFGMCVAHAYSYFLGQPFAVGTYLLFAVLCGSASYIALPAVQRMAIPEASPTLPLAASLGLTFSYNVTIGIPVYVCIAKLITQTWPVLVGA